MSVFCATTFYRPQKVKSRAHILINTMKKDHQIIYLKFQFYLDRFICGSVFNFFQYLIPKQNLEIIYSEAMTDATHKKVIGRIAQKQGIITILNI